MNLLTWILSLIIEWLRPLHRGDPVLAPVATEGRAGRTMQADPVAPPGAPGDHPRHPGDHPRHPDEYPRDVAREGGDVVAAAGSWTASSPGDKGLSGQRPGSEAIVGNGMSAANPFWRIGSALLARLVPASAPPPGASAWAAMVILPGAVVLLVQAGLASLGLAGKLLELVLTVLVLYFTVPLGRLWRRLDRLSLLAAAGDVTGFRQISARWQADGFDQREADALTDAVYTGVSGAPGGRISGVADGVDHGVIDGGIDSIDGSIDGRIDGGTNDAVGAGRTFDRAGFSLPLIDGYRDVFAPMFWFTLIGPAGPIAYGLARLLAARRAGLPRRALHWIDWLPSRLAAASFALGGHFDDAMSSFRAARAASHYERIDVRVDREPGFGPALVILPSAAGATGIRLASPAVEARLQQASGGHEIPETEPALANFHQLRSLIGRTAMLWGGLWVLLALAD